MRNRGRASHCSFCCWRRLPKCKAETSSARLFCRHTTWGYEVYITSWKKCSVDILHILFFDIFIYAVDDSSSSKVQKLKQCMSVSTVENWKHVRRRTSVVPIFELSFVESTKENEKKLSAKEDLHISFQGLTITSLDTIWVLFCYVQRLDISQTIRKCSGILVSDY